MTLLGRPSLGHLRRWACLVQLISSASLASSTGVDDFNGEFISGSGDADFLGLLDIARRQWSSKEVQYQSIAMLYDGMWDGLVEGPTWHAWWTQNSYGTTMTALPLMDDLTLAATAHSQAWWFNSIGNGTRTGLTGGIPAPDGCLCDAAEPRDDGEGCYYKQGDGNVPKHDWTMEESLSAMVITTASINGIPVFTVIIGAPYTRVSSR